MYRGLSRLDNLTLGVGLYRFLVPACTQKASRDMENGIIESRRTSHHTLICVSRRCPAGGVGRLVAVGGVVAPSRKQEVTLCLPTGAVGN